MNQHLQKILDFIQQDEKLTAEEKALLTKAAKSTDSDLSISEFKLDRTEKVKRTTAILLEETIEELEQKRKAVEEQNRELEVETSVERVRAQAMAMHQTTDLDKVNKELYNQLQWLKVEGLSGVSIYFIDEEGEVTTWDLSSPGNIGDPSRYTIRFSSKKYTILGELWEHYKKGEDYFTLDYPLEKLKKAVFEFKEIDAAMAIAVETAIHNGSLTHQWNAFGRISNGVLGIDLMAPPTEATKTIVSKMAGAFNLAYKRFLDLQKAEAQATEAQIQLALERVRARTMAMQNSNELLEAATLLFQQVQVLGASSWNCSFNIWGPERKYATAWNGSKDGFGRPFKTNSSEDVFLRFYEAAERGEEFYTEEIAGEALKKHYEYLSTVPGVSETLAELKAAGIELPAFQIFNIVYFAQGYLMFITYEPVPAFYDIFKRFGNVFEQTYTRFLDLQKAEAQAREAEIELALERVRARTMAMQHSDELADASFVLDSQVRALGIKTRGCAFNIYGDNESTEWFSSEMGAMTAYKTPREGLFLRYLEAGKNGEQIHIEKFEGEVCVAHYEYLCTLPGIGDGLKAMVAAGGSLPTHQVDHAVYFKYGYLLFITVDEVPEAHDIFIRFAKVFEQTYTRFLDLQKAEAQAREAQINLAVERVRAKALAMFRSEEILDVVFKLKEEIMGLDIPNVLAATIYLEEKNGSVRIWDLTSIEFSEGKYHQPMDLVFQIEKTDPDFFMRRVWNGKENYFLVTQDEEDFKRTLQWLRNVGRDDQAIETENFIKATQLKKLYHPTIQLNNGRMCIDLLEPPAEEIESILTKMGAAFNLAYKRFEDLKNSEAQLKEAKIEAALEKVRSRSLAMQKSEELKEVIQVVYDQFVQLNFNVEHTGFIIDYKKRDDMHIWLADKNGVPSEITIPYFDSPHWNSFIEAKAKGNNFFSNQFSFEEKNKFYRELFELIPGVSNEVKEYYAGCPGLAISTILLDNVGLYIENFSGTAYSDEENSTFMRFGKVFQQTYTRFLDLQNAEAQARESQIQLALERVRARTMAMQHSTDLAETSSVLFKQIKDLGFETWSCGFCIWQKHDMVEVWMGADSGGLLQPMMIPYKKEPTHHDIYKASLQGEIVHEKVWEGKALEEHYTFLRTIPSVAIAIKQLEDSGLSLPVIQCYYTGFFKQGYLLLITKETNAELYDLTKRFANVFEQTYTRFLDLQKAEAQARESRIEASLERVRSKAMSMQKSEDLAAAITIVFEELDKLDLGILRCGIGVLNKEKRTADVWTTTKSDNNSVIQVSGDESMDIHPLLSGAFDAWLNHEDHSYALKGEDLNNYYKAVAKENFKLPDSQSLVSAAEGKEQFYFNAVYSSGGLFAFRETPFPEEAKLIMKRFADVFTLTYTRYSDLKQAEAQAKEARIEVALERVRSRTLAMQKSEELAETAAVLFQQLIALGIEPNRLYISIVKNDKGDSEFWITDEDGSKVSTAFSANLEDNPTFAKMYAGWKQQLKSLVIDMRGEELQLYFNHLTGIGVPFKDGLSQKRRVQDIAYFSKGFIGIASPDEQPVETINLLERFAAVFNLTFTRFKDLKMAEAHAVQAEEDLIRLQTEKNRAEDALAELRSTQTQLIQSEKMASLGELTAGIAHEIQNPLNFVNNFSEVSKELLDEMKTALDSGDMADALDIASDVIKNLEKINHHGKRADAIVKGMLQHSRSSSGQKEPTNINALADEYLRLAYHGLRAKDKSFNATLKTGYDETIGNINIIPQDIGRVVLNLITNAFYAVAERKKEGSPGYEPTVSVFTMLSPLPRRGVGGEVLIKVADNGNGIPKNIVEKIFQPFFTTKPTGQGTGLGLSLAYDIIKAHGGQIKVETNGEGTTFIIQLPISHA